MNLKNDMIYWNINNISIIDISNQNIHICTLSFILNWTNKTFTSNINNNRKKDYEIHQYLKNNKIKSKVNDKKVYKKYIFTNAAIGCKFNAMHFNELIYWILFTNYNSIKKFLKC